METLKPKKQLLDLAEYQPGKPIEEVKRELGLTEVIKLASNENPFGSSPKAKAAIQEEMANLQLYPDGHTQALRTALAERFNVAENQLIFGCGSDELVAFVARTFLSPGDETVMADVTFTQYRSNAVIEGASVIEVPLVNGVHDLPSMAAAVTEKTKVIWVCNPNNPTGTYNTEKDLLAFLDAVPKEVLVVLDEAYVEYVAAEDYPRSLDLLNSYPNLLILRTFSKIYGLAALRIGYGIADATLIGYLNKVREPFNVNRLAEKAALAALQDDAFIASCQEKNRQGMRQYVDFCERHGLAYYPSQTNFILIFFGVDDRELFQSLLRRGLITRSGTALGIPKTLRITVGSQEQNEKMIKALEEILFK
jgi:histidinol-phosphate aminotransferase